VSSLDPLVLQQVGLFAGLSADDLGALAANLQRRRYPRGQVVFRQGDPGASLYLIEAGSVKIVVSTPGGKTLTLRILGPRDFFGELSLLDGEPRSADAIVHEACRLLLLQREDFLRFIEARPGVAKSLLESVSRRLRYTTRQVQDAAFLDVPARLARVIVELAQAGPAGASAIAPRPTQTELAEMVGATRESVNKVLGLYERQGLIRRERGAIIVLQPEALRKRIS
jgi:CRP/FNR family cyclic AMP-dependent transcriptional regulator